MKFSGEMTVGTETVFVSDQDLHAGAKQEKAQRRPVELPVWYLTGPQDVFGPVSDAVARGKSNGIPFAGMKFRVTFEGSRLQTGERLPGELEMQVARFEYVTVCPQKPKTLQGCSN